MAVATHPIGNNPEVWQREQSVVPAAKEPAHDNGVVNNSMRFSNSDVSLNDVIERNGGHIALANMDSLFAPF